MHYKILLPVDESKESLHAFDQTIFFARCMLHSKVTVMHVLHSSQHPENNKAIEQESERHGNNLLKEFGAKLQAVGVPYELELRYGYPSKVISDAVEEEKYDLLVIGSRGMGSFGEVVLGSVSHKVLHLVNCPVLVVH